MSVLPMTHHCETEQPEECASTSGVSGNTWPVTPEETRAFLDEHLDRLVLYAFRKLGNYHEAEDAVQDVLVRVLTGGARPKAVNVVAYLYRSVSNACLDILRRRLRIPLSINETDADRVLSHRPTPSEAAMAAEDMRRAEDMLGKLPEEQAEAIRLRVFDGLRLGQIAQIMGCPLHTVNSRLRYGFRRLRELVSRERSMDQ